MPRGVLYKVYGKDGELAPGAIVSGLPGLEPDKTYTANDKGEFIIPMADLPFLDEISFGRAESVTVNGESLPSANNTYVPNKFLYKFAVNNSMKFVYSDVLEGSFSLQVKRSPKKGWEYMPRYFNASSTSINAYLISDHNNPHSFVLDEKGNKIMQKFRLDYFGTYVVPSRPVIKSKRAPKNASKFWDGKPKYYLCDFNFGSFPGLIKEALIIEVPPIQYAPRIKSLVVKSLKKTETGIHYFESLRGEVDTSDIDFKRLYSVYKRDFSNFATGQKILFPPLSDEEVQKYKLQVYFNFREGGITHDVQATAKQATIADPTFKALLPYVGSYSHVDFNWSSTSGLVYGVSWIPDRTGGTLKYAPNGKDFLVTFNQKNFPNLKPVSVTYED